MEESEGKKAQDKEQDDCTLPDTAADEQVYLII